MVLIINNNKKKFFLYFSFIAIFLSSLLLYLPSFQIYFFQDDWFILNWVKTGNILSFISFRNDIIYWRPLSMPIYFSALNTIFGLNYVAFHIFAFFIFLLLLFLIQKLLKCLFEDLGLSLILTFLYAIWPINYISLSWLAATQYIIAPVFMTASFLSFTKYILLRKKAYLTLCYATFLAALISHETAIVLPALFIVWTAIYRRKISLATISPMLAISATIMIIRFYIVPLPAAGAYTIQINKAVFLNFIWYWLWSFNFPESFKSLVDPRVVEQSILVLKQFWWISLSCLTIIAFFLLMLARGLKNNFRNYLFGFSWFSIMLLPVIFIPSHSYPMYLSFAGLGLIYMIGTSLKGSKYILTFTFMVFWTISALANFQFTRATHWVESEQSISKTYIQFMKSYVNNPQKNSTFVFLPVNKNTQQKSEIEQAKELNTLKLSLSDQNAVQVIYGDTTLKSLYQLDISSVEKTTGKVYYIYPSRQ